MSLIEYRDTEHMYDAPPTSVTGVPELTLAAEMRARRNTLLGEIARAKADVERRDYFNDKARAYITARESLVAEYEAVMPGEVAVEP